MQIKIKKHGHKVNRRYISIFLLFLAVFLMGQGCAGTSKTTKTETTVTYPNDAGQKTTTTVSTSGDEQNNGVVGNSEPAATTTDVKDEHPGIISSTFHAIGYVISIPFIIIGGLFRIIFGG